MNKKPILITCVFYCLLISKVSAQRSELGVTGGPSVNMFSGNYNMSYYQLPKIGYSVGLTFHYSFERFSIGANALFERKGEKYSLPTRLPDVNTDIDNSFDYMSFPLLIGYKFGNKKNLRINLGGYYSYLLKQLETVEFNDEIFKSKNSELWKNFDFGLVGSVDYSLKLANLLYMNIEARTNIGLVDIHKQNDELDSNFDQFKQEVMNRSFLLLIGLNYTLD